jgi:hypothetical protein
LRYKLASKIQSRSLLLAAGQPHGCREAGMVQ